MYRKPIHGDVPTKEKPAQEKNLEQDSGGQTGPVEKDVLA
jgi:hypothetical protein